MTPALIRCTAFLTLGLLAGAVYGAEGPPRTLQKIDDHWTAWEVPESFPEGAQLYTIEQGDTLWDLAARFFGNAYLWPQIWERNQYIRDAHWIYPGDPLVLGIEVTPTAALGEEALGEEGLAGLGPGEGEEGAGPFGRLGVEAPIPLGSEHDLYCSGFIGDLDEPFGYHIIGSEDEVLSPSLEVVKKGHRIHGTWGAVDALRYGLSTGDVVYLDGGWAAGLRPGALFTAVQPADRPVVHPVRGNVLGRLYNYTGRVRILSVQEDTAIGEIVQSCTPVLIGSALLPFEPEPIPLARQTPLRPINDPAEVPENAAVIVRAKDRLVSLGADHVVFIDRGAEDDVTPGDIYTIYRRGLGGNPSVVLGELAVLSVHRSTSVAKIVRSRHTIYVGDLLIRKF